MNWASLLFACLAGALITIQAGSNSQLKKSLGEPMPAVMINYVIGFCVVVAYSVVRHAPMASLDKAGQVPWWAWSGGMWGSVYGVAAVLLASKLGAAPLTAFVVTGQLICSVLLDHFGWVGFEVHPAGWGRIVGCALMVAGLTLIAKF